LFVRLRRLGDAGLDDESIRHFVSPIHYVTLPETISSLFLRPVYTIDFRRATLARASRDFVAGTEIPILRAICFIE
jgi:hypothetical protein